jgi:hypothetical protein
MGLPFQTIDIGKQAQHYQLEQRGAEDGARNLPTSDSELEAQSEQTIVGAILAERARCLVDLSSQLRAERDALAHLQTAMDVAGMRQGADEADAELGTLKVRYASKLSALRGSRSEMTEEYTAFRRANKLTRMARQPKNRTQVVLLMCLFIVIEAVVNAWFFAGASERGLLGGAIMAAIFSTANIVVAVVNGWGPIRWANHRNLVIKLAGMASVVLVTAGSLLLNFFVAHYRDMAEVTAETPPLPDIFWRMLHAPFSLQGIESWFLMAFGIGFAVCAVAKGNCLDDPYPRYGSHDRRRLAARDAYEALRQWVVDHATHIRDEFNSEHRRTIETLRGASEQRQHILAARARQITEFEAHESNLTDAARQLLGIYRRANQAHRSTPPPPHFGVGFAFEDRGIDRPDIRVLREEQGLEVNADGLIRELDALRQRVLARFEELMAEMWAEERT